MNENRATKAFKVSGSKNENGPWKVLLEAELVDTTGGKAASLLNFTFDPKEMLQVLRRHGEGGQKLWSLL